MQMKLTQMMLLFLDNITIAYNYYRDTLHVVISLLTLNMPVSLSACESNTSWRVIYAMNLFSGLSVCLRKGGSVGLFVNRVYQFAERTEFFIISYF